MAPVIYDAGVSGTSKLSTSSTVTTRSYASTGQAVLDISNSNGDHVTPNAFSQYETHVQGGLNEGLYGNIYDYYYVTYKGFPSRIYDHRSYVGSITAPGGLGNKLFANTSPDRADVLLPTAVFELKDLPMAIYHAGYRLLKKQPKRPKPPQGALTQASAAWVALNFGWLPLIGDLKKLVEFSDLAHARDKEFDRLYSGKGLKRRQNLYSQEVARSLTFTSEEPGGINTLSGSSQLQCWGTCRWRPIGWNTGRPSARPTPAYVRRAVLGLNAANVTVNVWEALPWSWFIDYFFGVQDYLQANAGFQSAVPTQGVVMAKTITRLASPTRSRTDKFGRTVTLTAGRLHAENKVRTVVYPGSIEARIPKLSGKQVSILGALAVLKAPR